MRINIVCRLLVMLGLLLALPSAGEAARGAKTTHPAADTRILPAEIQLARAGFSPGVIDARNGDNFAKALHAFQQANGLPARGLDAATWVALARQSQAPALAAYTVQQADVEGPFVSNIPSDYAQMARLPRLGYRNPRELLAERFHMSEDLLAALNPGKNLAQAGTVITVADIVPLQPAAGAGATAGATEGSGSSSTPGATAVRVVVDKRAGAVRVYAADQRLIAFYPASIGSAEKPAPSGMLQVRSVARNPSYTYNPAYAFKGQSAQQPVEVPPGPNNPVGLVWIGLSLKGYGIHGTPDPDKVGKTQSHGCVRLTNWDALALAKLVHKGTPVAFIG